MVYRGRKNIKPLVISKKGHQILLGSLLGDAHLRRRGIYGNGIFQEEHCLKQMDYLRWKNSFLNFKEEFIKRNDKRFKSENYQQIRIYSLAKKELNYYHTLFYKNGKKRVTKEILEQLEPLAIAIWYCDDGCYDYRRDNVIFCIEGFNKKEKLSIIKFFKKKYGLNFKYYKKYIYLLKSEVPKFIQIIEPFIIKSMRYKIGLDLKRKKRAGEL